MAADLTKASVKPERRYSRRLSNHFDSDSSMNVKQNLIHRYESKEVEQVSPHPLQEVKTKKKEKKENEENPLTAKEVFNVQHPPSLTQREKLCWIQENRISGTWIQCTAPTCKKWRYVEDILDPTTVTSGWICALNPDTYFNSCYTPTAPNLNGKVLITLKYDAGSIVLAKSARKGVKWWPAMIDDDPHYEQFYWPGRDRIVVAYHVVYFDEPGKPLSRDWRNENAVKKFIPELNLKCQSNYAKRIKAAHEEACNAMKLSILDRLTKYSYIRRYTGPSLAGLSEWIKDYYCKKGYMFEDDSDCTISSRESSPEPNEINASKVQFNLDLVGPTNSHNNSMDEGESFNTSYSSIESENNYKKMGNTKRKSVSSEASSAFNSSVKNVKGIFIENKIKKSSKQGKANLLKKSIQNIKRTESGSTDIKPCSWLTPARVRLENLSDSRRLLDTKQNRSDSIKRRILRPEMKKIEKKKYKIKEYNRVISRNKIISKKANSKDTNKSITLDRHVHINRTKNDIKHSGINVANKSLIENLHKIKDLIVTANSSPMSSNQSLDLFNKQQNIEGEDANRPLEIRRTPRRSCKNEELNYSIYWWHRLKLPKGGGAYKKILRRNCSFHDIKSTTGEPSGYYSDFDSSVQYAQFVDYSFQRGCESEYHVNA